MNSQFVCIVRMFSHVLKIVHTSSLCKSLAQSQFGPTSKSSILLYSIVHAICIADITEYKTLKCIKFD